MSNALELFDLLTERSVYMTAEGGDRLRVNAPRGMLSPQVRNVLASSKADLLHLLRLLDESADLLDTARDAEAALNPAGRTARMRAARALATALEAAHAGMISGPVRLRPGHSATDPNLFLLTAMRRASALRQKHGSDWMRANHGDGAILVDDIWTVVWSHATQSAAEGAAERDS